MVYKKGFKNLNFKLRVVSFYVLITDYKPEVLWCPFCTVVKSYRLSVSCLVGVISLKIQLQLTTGYRLNWGFELQDYKLLVELRQRRDFRNTTMFLRIL